MVGTKCSRIVVSRKMAGARTKSDAFARRLRPSRFLRGVDPLVEAIEADEMAAT